METFKDILCRQTDTLQSYFDSCANKNNGLDVHQHLDLRDEQEEGTNIKILFIDFLK